MDPIWYLGPEGDLRALTCPDPDINMPVVRYGGTHQGLSGSRWMDVTGHRANYEFSFEYMEEDEWNWLEAMHLRHIPGPYRMISPMKRNRLTPESSSARMGGGTARGMTTTIGQTVREWDWPVGAGTALQGQSTRWFGRGSLGVFRFDEKKKSTVVAGEQITGSVWIKAANSLNLSMVFDWYTRGNIQTSSTPVVKAITTSWQRFSITETVPAGTVKAVLAGFTSNTADSVYIAAAQLEQGVAPTDFQLGGGAPIVLVDQLSTSSPIFPLTDCGLTLLEA